MWARIGPAAGIVGWIISLVGFGIHGYPTMGASGAQLAKWASTTDPNRFAIGIDVEAVGILIVILFYAWLCDLIRRSDAPSWLAMFAFALMVVWGAAGIFANGTWTALLDIGRRGADPQLLAATRDVAQELFNATYVFFGLSMIAIAAAAYVGKSLPMWLAWPALVIGIGLAIPATVNLAGLAVILWAFVTGGLFVVRPASSLRSHESLS